MHSLNNNYQGKTDLMQLNLVFMAHKIIPNQEVMQPKRKCKIKPKNLINNNHY